MAIAYCVAGNGWLAQTPVDCGAEYKPPFASGGGACVFADQANAPGYAPKLPQEVVGVAVPPRYYRVSGISILKCGFY